MATTSRNENGLVIVQHHRFSNISQDDRVSHDITSFFTPTRSLLSTVLRNLRYTMRNLHMERTILLRDLKFCWTQIRK